MASEFAAPDYHAADSPTNLSRKRNRARRSPQAKTGPKKQGRSDLFADSAYDLKGMMDKAAFVDFVVELIRRSEDQKSFQVLPRRWAVERTLPPMAVRQRHRLDDPMAAPRGRRREARRPLRRHAPLRHGRQPGPPKWPSQRYKINANHGGSYYLYISAQLYFGVYTWRPLALYLRIHRYRKGALWVELKSDRIALDVRGLWTQAR